MYHITKQIDDNRMVAVATVDTLAEARATIASQAPVGAVVIDECESHDGYEAIMLCGDALVTFEAREVDA